MTRKQLFLLFAINLTLLLGYSMPRSPLYSASRSAVRQLVPTFTATAQSSLLPTPSPTPEPTATALVNRLPAQTEFIISFGGELLTAQGVVLPMPDPKQLITSSIVRTISPASGISAPNVAIRVGFDRPLDQASVEAAFQLSPTIEGDFSWQENGLIFTPSRGYLDENTTYTVMLAPTVKDMDGQPMLGQPYSWGFMTSELNERADFGAGPNAQVVDVEGRRAVQFQRFSGAQDSSLLPIALQFKLYRLTLPQFLDRYSSGFRGVVGWDKRTLRTDDLAFVTSWQADAIQQFDPPSQSYTQETILSDDLPPGLYILQLGSTKSSDQLLLLLTRNVIMLKQVEGEIVAWVSDINGASVVDVAVYARNGELLSQGRSDANGIFRTKLPDADQVVDPQPLIVIAQVGDDITATGLSNEWRSRNGQWWNWWQAPPLPAQFATYIHTDRPIYRPRQTVYFKAILRHDDDASIQLPTAGMSVTARIRDARNNLVQTTVLTTNDFGTLHGQFQLADGAMLGEYAVELALSRPGLTVEKLTAQVETYRQIFKVQDYRKPDYEVIVQADAEGYVEGYVEGDTINLHVESRYFYNEPVANASLKIQQFQLWPKNWWESQPKTPEYTWYNYGSPTIEGQTSASGQFSATFAATGFDNGVQQDWQSSLKQSIWGIEATVDDGSHQTVSGFAVVKVYNAAEKLQMATGGYVQTPGQPFTVTIRASTLADEAVANRVLKLQIERLNWTVNGQGAWTQNQQLTTDASGQAQTALLLNEAGYYNLVVSGIDRLGNAISYTSWLFVFAENQSSWSFYGNASKLRINSDRDSYAPGDSARLLIESGFGGAALLTFERGTTRRQQLIQLNAGLTIVDVPIQPDDAPNIFVTVNAWEAQDTTLKQNGWQSLPDSHLYQATVELHVPVTAKRLTVTLTPNQLQYNPREKATFNIEVKDEAGQPVMAELSLALVDEAIFSLSEELSGSVFDAFYRERANLVRSYDGLALVRWLGGGMGGGGGGGGLLANPRSTFPDTAFWLPVLHTNRAGKAEISITLPDNLTSWRLTAKAVTANETQVGETFVNVVTQQLLVVQPILPRGLTVGDQVGLSALVHNYSNAPRDLTVSLVISTTSDGALLQALENVTQSIRLEPDQSQVVGWQVRAIADGAVKVTMSASDGEIADAVQLDLPIHPLSVPDVVNQIGEFSGEFNTIVRLPRAALPRSSVKIELSRSIAGSLLTGLEYLTGYPYGCVEQTMSRSLPNAVVGRVFQQLGVANPTLQADLPPLINAGLQRLYGFQHNDGGWGWWLDDDTDAYQTAWVIFGLSVTQQAGYAVDPAVIKRGIEWLRQHLNEMDIRTRTYALYSMAVAGETDVLAVRDLVASLDELDPFSQAALALALYLQGMDDQAQQIIDRLAQSAVIEEGRVFWRTAVEDGHYQQKTMSSSTRTTALILSAFVRIQPEHELEAGIVRWLMSQRRENGWGSTNETSYAILALTDHLLTTQEANAQTTYQVELNGAIFAQGTLGPGEPAIQLEILAAQMQPGDNQLRIAQSDSANRKGRLFYVVSNRSYLAQSQIEAAGTVNIERTYSDAMSNQPITSTAVGQLIKVSMRVNVAEPTFYMIVEDKLPAGLEALNESLNTTSHVTMADNSEPHYYWRDYGYNQKEVHGDRVSFFITEFATGQHEFSYYARATHTGNFVALPAEAYAMYDVTTWGRSASQTFAIATAPADLPN